MYNLLYGVSAASFLHGLGPLLYHFADTHGELSIELSWNEIRRIAEHEIGFEILVTTSPSH